MLTILLLFDYKRFGFVSTNTESVWFQKTPAKTKTFLFLENQNKNKSRITNNKSGSPPKISACGKTSQIYMQQVAATAVDGNQIRVLNGVT